MRTAWTSMLAAALAVIGAVSAQAADDKAGKPGSELGSPPAIQGESWFGTGDPSNNRMGERRTDSQRNAIETKDQGPVGKVPDAARGETGLKGESGASGASPPRQGDGKP